MLLAGVASAAFAQVPSPDSSNAARRGVALAGPVAEAWLPTDTLSRAEALKRARHARLGSLRSPEQGRLEAFLIEHEDALTGGPSGPRRFYVVLGGTGGAASIAGGLGVRAFPGRTDRELNAQVVASTRGSIAGRVVGGVRRGPVALEAIGRAVRYNEERVYALGTDAGTDHQRYELREGAADALAVVQPWHPLRLAATAGYRAYDLREEVVLQESLGDLPGTGADPAYAVAGLQLALDLRDGGVGRRLWFGSRRAPGGTGNPQRGLYAAVAAERFEEVGGAGLSFMRYEAEAQAYLAFRYGYQRLALRHRTVYTDPDGGAAVPFYLQPFLGSSYTLRGFPGYRFRDRGALLFNAEYRWRVWRLLDLALFADAGCVFHELDGWGVGELEVGYGGGLRVVSRTDLLFRLDLARSREGVHLHASFVAPF